MLPLFFSFNLLVEEYINDGVGKEKIVQKWGFGLELFMANCL